MLNDVDQFVGEQTTPGISGGLEFARAEGDVATNGERACVNRPGNRMCFRVGMHPNLAQVNP